MTLACVVTEDGDRIYFEVPEETLDLVVEVIPEGIRVRADGEPVECKVVT